LGWPNPDLYSGYASFADWRAVDECDYATNSLVANHYRSKNARILRKENSVEFWGRLELTVTYLWLGSGSQEESHNRREDF